MNQVNQSTQETVVRPNITADSRNPFNESGQSISELKELLADPKIVVIPSMNQVNQSTKNEADM